MSTLSPKNKVWVISILCFAVVASVWLSQRQVVDTKPIYEKANSIEPGDPLIKVSESTNTDWEKILVSMKPEKTKDLTVKPDEFNDTAITAKLSRDFMSQYLLLKKGGATLTNDQINQIVNDTLVTKEYTQVAGAIYVASNLNVTKNNDPATQKRYKDNVNLIMKVRNSELSEDPMILLNQIVTKNNTAALVKFDTNIKVAKGFIQDFLKIEVPSQAVSTHLELLNSVSTLVADIEAMRVINDDPIRSLLGMSQYGTNLKKFQEAVRKMNSYTNSH